MNDCFTSLSTHYSYFRKNQLWSATVIGALKHVSKKAGFLVRKDNATLEWSFEDKLYCEMKSYNPNSIETFVWQSGKLIDKKKLKYR